MGQFISNFFASLFNDKQAKILFLGLDGAGKTATLYKLHLDENVETIPTIGFNVEAVRYKKISFTIFDVGGQYSIRKLWKHYYQNTEAIVFIVDSNDHERFEEASESLHYVMDDPLLSNAKLLILANKQDLSRAANVQSVAEKLKLTSLKQEWFIQPCSAINGTGLFEGFDWLSRQL